MSSELDIKCPKCGGLVTHDPASAGQPLSCPHCGELVTTPAPSPPEYPPPAVAHDAPPKIDVHDPSEGRTVRDATGKAKDFAGAILSGVKATAQSGPEKLVQAIESREARGNELGSETAEIGQAWRHAPEMKARTHVAGESYVYGEGYRKGKQMTRGFIRQLASSSCFPRNRQPEPYGS